MLTVFIASMCAARSPQTHFHFIVSLNPDGHRFETADNFGGDNVAYDLLTNFAGPSVVSKFAVGYALTYS
jgi:hypothetical protein